MNPVLYLALLDLALLELSKQQAYSHYNVMKHHIIPYYFHWGPKGASRRGQ